MDEVARAAYVRRLDAEVLAADAELTELEAALEPEEGCGSPVEDIPELGWARARCEALRGWVQLLKRQDLAATDASGRQGAALRSPARGELLQVRAEHARGELLRARLLVHERILLLRQDCAFRHEAQLRLLEQVHLRAETVASACYPQVDRPLQLALAWQRYELQTAWRLMEQVLRADDRDWPRARRDFEQALAALSRSAQRLASGSPGPERLRFA